MGLKSTYVDRANTNQFVFRKANECRNLKKTPEKNIKLFSEYIHTTQHKLLAHTIRSPLTDPLRQCTLASGTFYPNVIKNRRVGRPRHNWTWKSYERLAMKNTPATKQTFKENPGLYIDMMQVWINNKKITT